MVISYFDSDSLLIPNFSPPLRCDRTDRLGVAVYFKDTLACSLRHDFSVPGLEAIWVQVIHDNKTLLIGGFYRPPNSNNHYWSLIEESFDRAYSTNIENVIILGDFNINMYQKHDNKLTHLISSYHSYQLISGPTHFTENSSSLIDIISVKRPDSVVSSYAADCFLPDLIRYHCPIIAVFNFKNPKSVAFNRSIWKYELGDYTKYCNILNSTNWNTLLSSNALESLAMTVNNVIIDATKQSIPNKVISIRNSDVPCFNSRIRTLIRQTNHLHKRAKSLIQSIYGSNLELRETKPLTRLKRVRLILETK